MNMPDDAPTKDPIEYLVLHKPLSDLQHELNSKASEQTGFMQARS